MHQVRNIQAPYVEADFWTQWSGITPRMALFVLVTPKSFWTGVSAVGFTSNTRDMTLPGHAGVTFKSSPGITPTVVEQALGESTTLEMSGIYQTGIFERTDVLAGKWNFATVEIFSACWDNTALGELVHFKGNLGEFKDHEISFTGEGRGLIDRLTNDVNTVTQRLCRVKDFGDATCGKDLSGTVTIDGTAYNLRQTGVSGSNGTLVNQIIFDTSTWAGNNPPPFDLYKNGKITCKSGDNNGVSRETAATYEATGGLPYVVFELKRAFPFEITGSETFDLVAGCTRTLEDCRKYSNTANFRGEPYVPGIEASNRVGAGN